MHVMNRLLLVACASSLIICSSAIPGEETTLNLPCDCPQMPLYPLPDDDGYYYVCAHFDNSCNEIPSATTLEGLYPDWPYICDNCESSIIAANDERRKFDGLKKKFTPLQVPETVSDTEKNIQRLTEEFIRVRHPVTRKEYIAKLFTYALTVPNKPGICTKHIKLIHVAYEVESIPDTHHGLPVSQPKSMTDVVALPGNLALSVNDGHRVDILVLLAAPAQTTGQK